MKLEITKEKVLEAASKCEIAKETLKVLFPDVFKEEECWLLYSNPNTDEIFFKNNITHKTFFVGDKVTMSKPNHSFSDGVRDYVISGFYISSNSYLGCELKNTKYKKVFALFKGYSCDRVLSLEEIVKIP